MSILNPLIIEQSRKKKENFEPLPLYVELGPPPQKEGKDEEKEEKPSVIIIDIL